MVDSISRPGDLLAVSESVLVAIDIQGKLLSAMPLPSAQVMLTNISRLMTAADWLNLPILLTEQYPKGLGPTAEAIANQLPEDARRFRAAPDFAGRAGGACLRAAKRNRSASSRIRGSCG